ncbi:CRISPR-associated endoribonuclease Cas6 [Algivirga pacifica]|uniref:CRISPR-associated endoribonuclease Cas6 n=1 Tax=Algivirga pacifica TaxID=1162670 RepID=A0ABP9DKB2_9BACT
MRVKIKTSSTSNKQVPRHHLKKLKGTIHKWIGGRDYHGELGAFSFSKLNGGVSFSKDFLTYPKGAFWFISSPDTAFIKRVIRGIQEDPSMFFGLEVEEIQLLKDPEFKKEVRFLADSPILVKKKRTENRGVDHLTFQDPEADEIMTNLMKRKLKSVGLTDEIQITFDRSYQGANTTVVVYNGVKNKCSICPVIISGNPEAIAYAWNVGVGNSTGTGFGAIR